MKQFTKQKPETFKTRDEWLAARAIGGSDIGVILGLSKWQTIEELYEEKVYGSKEKSPTALMERGTKAEAHIRDLFALSSADEFEVKNPPKGGWLYRNPSFWYLTCSPDGLLRRKSNGSVGGLEIKFVDLYTKEQREKWQDAIPDTYYAQCAHYLNCIPELDFVILVAFQKFYTSIGDEWVFEHGEMNIYPIYRSDEETQRFMRLSLKKAKDFNDSLTRRTLPTERITFSKKLKGEEQ